MKIGLVRMIGGIVSWAWVLLGSTNAFDPFIWIVSSAAFLHFNHNQAEWLQELFFTANPTNTMLTDYDELGEIAYLYFFA